MVGSCFLALGSLWDGDGWRLEMKFGFKGAERGLVSLLKRLLTFLT